ncbi:MAG TPA: hypothetical protein VGD46_22680 [Rhizobacter sp.]
MSKKLLAAIVATTLGCGAAIAQTNNDVLEAKPNTPQSTSGVLTQEGKDAKETAKGEYKARKKVAEANKELNKADCEVAANGMAEHACKKHARSQAKTDKAEAKMIYENEKKDIKANHAK